VIQRGADGTPIPQRGSHSGRSSDANQTSDSSSIAKRLPLAATPRSTRDDRPPSQGLFEPIMRYDDDRPAAWLSEPPRGARSAQYTSPRFNAWPCWPQASVPQMQLPVRRPGPAGYLPCPPQKRRWSRGARPLRADRDRIRPEAARESWARLILTCWPGRFTMASRQGWELIDRDMQYAAAAIPKNAGLT
jgi:hypothetical protein